MLQLFLWLGILPVAILLVMEQLRVFMKEQYSRTYTKVLVFVITVHVLFILWLLTQEGIVWSSFLAVGIPCLFCDEIGGWWDRRILHRFCGQASSSAC